MASGYQRGILIVVLAVVLAGGLSATLARVGSTPAPAGQELGDSASAIGPFSLVERSGETVTDATLGDRVWIASFIFTRCKLSCPRITSIMKSLQERLADSDVQLVSLSVDPEYDTPEVLAEYASRFDADPSRWWFLTGPRDAVLEMINKKFLLTVMTNPSPAPDGSEEAVVHSDRLALVDRGKLVGLFDTHDPAALDALVKKARRRATPTWARSLPALNASLNGLCTVLLLVGWTAIRGPRRRGEALAAETALPVPSTLASRVGALLRAPDTRGHLLAMGMAVLASAAFLGCYLLYHYFAGSVEFAGRGGLRWLYLTILGSHTLLATFFVVPLVFVTLLRAATGDYSGHVRTARVAFPIWLYVSITGVVIYLMLYRLPLPAAGTLGH